MKATHKKIIAIVLAAVILVSSVFLIPLLFNSGGPVNLLIDSQVALAAEHTFDTDFQGITWPAPTPLSIGEALAGQTARDGFILAPTIFGLTGIDPVSTFVLRTPEGFSDAAPSIFIDGQDEPAVIREDENTFIVAPAMPLTSNSVYVFRLARDGFDDVTWAFQTAASFEITSTLPRHQSTNVPVSTGIEIEFSYGAAPDISGHFSIYPYAEGRFTQRGSTAIFMPTSPLELGQIYTVTISAGIGIPNTSDVISSDYIFSFETSPSADLSNSWGRSVSVNFSNQHVEFPSFAAPSVNFWLNYDWDKARPQIEMNVYRLGSRADAISAVNLLAGTPYWSQIYDSNRLVDTSGLSRVSSTRHNGVQQEDYWGWHETFTLPNALSPGFYVLDASTGGSNDQVVIQITDLVVQVIADDDKTLLWINDMTTGLPAAGARVHDPIANRNYVASEYGLAIVERELSDGEHLIIAAADGKEIVVFAHSFGFQSFYRRWGGWEYYEISPVSHGDWSWTPWMNSYSANNHYWTALQLDRTLFQRSDTISLWGFAQNRRRQENITHVTAVITEHAWWHSPERDTLHTQNIPVQNGSYSGEIHLPNIDPGYYELAIFHGDIAISSMFFSIMDYAKPPYQLSVSSSKSAIFAGEEVTFTAKTEFFEGTPVPDLDISYNFWGWDLTAPDGGQRQTNLDGVIELSARPAAMQSTSTNRVQGERQLGFMAEASLPEIGWSYQDANVRVFVNDIEMRATASREGRDATLSVDVHGIVLDRINDGTSEHWGDYLGAAKAGQRISVEISELYWEAVREGERYDHVTRQVIPKYTHVERVRQLEQFELFTDAEGAASRDFQVPNREKASYRARLTTTDGNGRTIVHDVYIGRDYTSFYRDADDDFPFLDGANQEGYDLGDEVQLTVMRGTEPVTRGNFLFVVVQGGVMSYHIGKNTLTLTFGEKHVPNAQVFAYHFNGHTYHTSGQMTQVLHYNPTNRNLNIEITANQEAYRPGEAPTFTITTTDKDGNPKAANVNISLVDEALFALMDYSVDTLAMLYGNVDDNLRISMATHRTFVSDGIEDGTEKYALGVTESGLFGMSADSAAPMPAPAENVAMEAESDGSGGGGSTRIRERFEDTAVFASLRTNAQGVATFAFPLPDNITSWRVTASAISDDLYAGNNISNVRVTQPMFLHYTLGSTFLAGDAPYVGVNAYGTSLAGGERVTFEVWREDEPGDVRTATGVSFERVNIPLWGMDAEGHGSIVIRATMDNGYSDAVRHSYQVVNSHRLVDSAVFYDNVTAGTAFDVNPGGLTNITFTDQGRGQFLRDLFGLRHIWSSGARVEGLVAKREATRLIRTHFPDVDLYGDSGSFDMLEYQMENGGIAILPYANADLQATVMLIPFVKDDVNLVTLRSYLHGMYSSSSGDRKMLALYGLAMLGEPVLLELQGYAMLHDLPVRDAAYVALGLAALGERHAASSIYSSRIAPHIQRIEPYYRVNAGANRAEILDATSAAALLAAQLGMPESMGLFNYAADLRFDAPSRFDDDALFMRIERLAFISHEINNHSRAAAGITYTLFGESVTRDLGHGGQFTLRIPAQSMDEFNLVSVAGNVGAVSIVRTTLEEMNTVSNEITIRREFFKGDSNIRATSFEQDELVRVQISINYSPTAISGSYEITDFLPAGLVHVANSARFGNHGSTNGWWSHVTTEGQRITFFDHNGWFEDNHTYYYYARVINPGTFKAEGTLVQSRGAREFMAVGAEAALTINP